MSRKRIYLFLIFVLILSALGAFVVMPQGTSIAGVTNPKEFKFGLDLMGGSQLEYIGDLSEVEAHQRGQAMESLRSAIERRIQGRTGGGLGVTEPIIQIAGEDRLIVQLPGITDVTEAIEVIGQTPFLEFREVGENGGFSDEPEDWAATGLTGRNLSSASVEFDQATRHPVIALRFDREGARLFEQITERSVGQPLAVFLDNELLQAPVVQTRIAGGEAIITGGFSIDEARTIVSRLNSGAIPVPIELAAQQTVGATLGELSLEQSVLAGILGLIAIFLFMFIFYRLPGLLAGVALLIYILLSLAIFKLLPVTLTLAGIAGFILSIGIAVDANILIFERIKEELRNGKDFGLSIKDGFDRAWLAIRDSNFSTLITTFILGYFGTSVVRGFAITLSIGVILSMFTAIVITRSFLFFFLSRKFESLINKPWFFGIGQKT